MQVYRTAYVVENTPGRDYRGLYEFVEQARFLLNGSRIPMQYRDVQIRLGLVEFDHERDLLVPNGGVISVAMVMFALRDCPELRIAVYDQGTYHIYALKDEELNVLAVGKRLPEEKTVI